MSALGSKGLFVGRQRELAALELGLEAAASGRGSVFLIVGEGGIGKTRLAEELCSRAQRLGAKVAWGRAWEEGGAPAYWPWVQVMRSLGPERRSALEAPDASLPAEPDSERERFVLFDSVTSFLKGEAQRQPLVLVLDDLHAATSPSLLLLQFLSRELRDARMLVIGTYRENEAATIPSVARALGQIGRRAERVELAGLVEAEVALLIEKVSRRRPDPSLVAAVHTATDGNPFLVDATLRELGPDDELRLPREIQETVRQRLEPLAQPTRRMLGVAAVIGREFDLGLLEAACRGPEELPELLREARRAGVIREVPASAGHYAFAHGLIRATLYRDLPPDSLRSLHRRVGETLEGLYAGDPDAHVAELAHHFVQAAGGEPEKSDFVRRAVEYARRAGDRAQALLAYEEAVTHYEHARRLVEQTAPLDEALRGALLLSLGSALRKAGDATKSREIFLLAARSAREASTPELLARAALGFGASGDSGGYESVGHVDPEQVSLLEEALASQAHDPPLRARLLGRLAMALYWSRARERRESLCGEAMELAERSGDPAILAATLASRCFATWRPDNLEERLETATRLLRVAEQARHRERSMQAHVFRSMCLLEGGDMLAVDREIEACTRLSEELRQPRQRGYALMLCAMRALLAGRSEEGERLAREGLALSERGLKGPFATLFSSQIFHAWNESGRLEALETAIAVTREQLGSVPASRCALAYYYSELGRLELARSEFEPLAAQGFADLPRDLYWLVGMGALARTCTALGDAARAERLYALLLPYAGRHVVNGPPPAQYLGPVAALLGCLATTAGRFADASLHLEAALASTARMGARPYHARTLRDLARMLLARGGPGDAARAIERAEEALGTARELGMKAVEAELVALREKAQQMTAAAAPTAARFCREGDFWGIGYHGTAFRLRESKGLAYLAQLLGDPGREFHVLDLLDPSSERQRETPGLASLDARAKSEYRRRLDELRGELAEAERNNDLARATRLREEVGVLTDELARSLGLGGRNRRAPDASERARQTVSKAIKAAIERIARNDASLGHHLRSCVQTGLFCSYAPDPLAPVPWEL